MDLKQQILHYYRVEEKSLREIARLTKTDRKTVSRLVHDFEAAIEKDPDLGMTEVLEIEIGSEDILAQLDRAMENGAILENK